MKVLVLGGMHGNEILGIKLVESLQQNPISGVDSLIANPSAVRNQTRFSEADLNRSFGTQSKSTYESRRAKKLTGILQKYDVVLDFHNTQTPGNNCCFVGEDCNPILYTVAKGFGFKNCIEATYDCVNKYCLNTISLEISVGDAEDLVEIWRQRIVQLVRFDIENDRSLFMYRFLRRVTWSEKDRYILKTWQPFVDLTMQDKMSLHVNGDVTPIFIGSKLTEFYATLLTRIGEK